MFDEIRSLPWVARVIIVIMMMKTLYICGNKPDPDPAANRVAQLVLALSGGRLVDPSGVIGSAVQIAAIEMFNAETAAIVAAASNIVAQARDEYDELVAHLATNDYSVAYIGYDFPRANPLENANHNITVTILRTSQRGTDDTLSAWVYFSEEPVTNVNVNMEVSVASGVWVRLQPQANTWPATDEVAGLPCYRYDYAIPVELRGVPLKPAADVVFGGYAAGQYLAVPADGVTVETNGVSCLPYTGWDMEHPDPWGTNLALRYIGGVAIEAILYGTNYTGVVNKEVGL